MQATVEVEETVCGKDKKPGCIPSTSKIPYMASGAYLDLIRRAKEGGASFFDPDRYPSWQDSRCANKGSYDGIQFQNFWEGVDNVTESPPLSVDQPNGYTECQDALNGTIEWKLRAEKTVVLEKNTMQRTAQHLIRCFECRIGSESRKLEREYKGSKRMQVQLAHVLRDLDQNYVKYLDEAHGFDRVQPIKEVLAFKNYESYFKCHSVLEANKKKECYFELSRYHEERKGDDDAEMRKIREGILETLKAKMSCTCDDTDNSEKRSFSCRNGNDHLFFECPRDHVCNQDMFVVNFGLDPNMEKAKNEHCKPAKKCNDNDVDLETTCGNIYFFPDPVSTYKVCKSEFYCARSECCTSEREFQLQSWRKSRDNKPMCMSDNGNSAVEMRPCDGHKSTQQWTWKDGGSSTHLLVNYALGKCVEAEGDQQWVNLKDCNSGSAQQQWKYVSGSRTIFNPDSGKVLDVYGAERYIADRTGVIIWGDNTAIDYGYTFHQQWHFMPSGDDDFAQKFV